MEDSRESQVEGREHHADSDKNQQHHRDEARVSLGSLSLDNRYVFLLLVLAIFAVNIWLRSGLLRYQGMFEPDGFFYYTAIKQAIANSFMLTHNVTLSGFPYHNHFGEAGGLPYFTLVPYFFLRFAGVSAYDIMRLMPMLFGILNAVALYFLAKHLANSRMLGLLAMFFISASSGNIARTAGTIYRGDTFITVFAVIALILVLKVMAEENSSKKYLYLAAGVVVASMGNVFWNGGFFIMGVYFSAVALLVVYSFIAADRKAMDGCVLLLIGLLAAILLYRLYLYAGLASNSPFSSDDFLLLFFSVFVGALFARHLISFDKFSFLSKDIPTRIVVFAVVMVVILAVLGIGFTSQVNSVLAGSGVITSGNISGTTQELQKPTLDFLESSFGLELIFAPIGALLFVFFAHVHGNTRHLKRGMLRVNVNYGFVVVLSFLIVTSILQYNAIRYNSLIAAPIAVFAAYAVYLVGRLLKDYAVQLGGTQIRLAYVYTGFVLAMLLFQATASGNQSFSSGQADGINPAFLQAMTWISNNTAANATFLALWPDGSVVEGWGNRASLMDSVGGENGSRITEYANFLGNTSPDPQYLYTQAKRPGYIIVRNFWMAELGGLLAESNSIANLSQYGYTNLNNITIGGNYSYQIYQLSNPQYRAEIVIRAAQNGTRNITALLGNWQSDRFAQIKYVVFLNVTSSNYSQVTNPLGTSSNYTIMLQYSGRNITGAMLLAPALPFSNLFRLLFECSPYACAYDNPNVTVRQAYYNGDSKILKVTYLH